MILDLKNLMMIRAGQTANMHQIQDLNLMKSKTEIKR